MFKKVNREGCFIKFLKGVLKVLLVIAGLIVFLIYLFFFLVDYNSPINSAGREYRDAVRSYRNEDIETMEDVMERLEVIDTQFHSQTFDKMSNADKREVTRSDIETLFGEPHEVVEDVDMYEANQVYQYTYEDLTLNFHQNFQTIDEFVAEHYTGTLYNATTLDALFMDTIVNHQSQYTKEEEEFPPLSEEAASSLMMETTPTRSIRQSGWYTWTLNRQDYFDDGQGEYSPTEYLALQFMEEEETTELYLMERRYQETFLKRDTPEEYEKKRGALSAIPSVDVQENPDNRPTVGDFSNALGETARMIYNFRDGTLGISWLMYDGEYVDEVMATTAPITAIDSFSDLDDLNTLEVVDYRIDILSLTDRILNADAFIGRR